MMLDSILKMIDSPNANDRHMGLTILFNQWDDFSKEELNKVTIAFFEKLNKKSPDEYDGRRYYHMENNRTMRQIGEDIEFVVEHVCDDPKKLGQIFMFNVDGIIRDVKIKKINNERQTQGNRTGTITN